MSNTFNPKTDLIVTAVTTDGHKVTGYYRYYPADRIHLVTDKEGFRHEVDPKTVKLKKSKTT